MAHTLIALALLGAPPALAWDAPETQGGAELSAPEHPELPALPIIHGDPAAEDDWPMAGALMLDATAEIPGFGSFDLLTVLCSSTLIAPDVVLLAGHCVDEDALNASLTFGYGTTTIHEMAWSRQADLSAWAEASASTMPDDAITVTETHVYPGFSIWNIGLGIGQADDIALMFLDTALEDAPRGVLVTEEEAGEIAEGNPVSIVGWGQQEATNWWDVPPPGSVGVKMMGDSVIGAIGSHEMQIGVAESDVRKCHGDSGGPTFMQVSSGTSDPWRVVGVTSHSYDETDCFETGGVDTRVDPYLTWIDEQLRDGCDRGVRVWCDEPGILAPDYGSEGDTDTDTDADTDTDTDTDTDVDTDTGTPDDGADTAVEGGGKGCGCAGGPGAVPLFAIAVAGLAASRRRRRG